MNDTFRSVRELQRGGLDVEFERVETLACLQAALEKNTWDLIICGYCLPHLDAATALALCHERGLDIPFIVLAGEIEEEHSVEMLKAGAHDCVTKDNLAGLVPAVNRELRAAQERRIRTQTETAATSLASLVRSSEGAMVGQTLDGTVVSWNAGAERLYGYTPSEMIGRSVSALIPSYHPEGLSEILEKLAQGERVEHSAAVRIRKDGTTVEVSLIMTPVKDAGGRIIGAATVSQVLSQRQQEDRESLVLIGDPAARLAVTTQEAYQPKPDLKSAA